MKKRLLSLLLCLALTLTLLPTAAFAAVTRLKSVDIVIDLPKAGDPNEMETQVTVRSIKSGGIDLLANGATVLYTEWQGDDVVTGDDEYLFRAGTTYLVNVKLAFDTAGAYCANYSGSDYVVGPETFSATVNGVPATVRTSAAFFPTLQVSLTIPGQRLSEEEKAELEVEQAASVSALAATRRAMYPSVTQAQAGRNNLTAIATNLVILDGSDKGDGYDLSCLDGYSNVGTVILDAGDSDFYNTYCAESFPLPLTNCRYAKEVWLSSKVDVYTFIQRMDEALRNPLDHSFYFESYSADPFYTAATTLFIPKAAVPALKASLNERAYTIPPTPSRPIPAATCMPPRRPGPPPPGNGVPATSSPGRSAPPTGPIPIPTAAPPAQRRYYSCFICGKCEYNANHVAQTEYIASTISMAEKVHNGEYYAELPCDSAYVRKAYAAGITAGVTATLAPNGTCTIEQAVIVAERSVYAHQIGWYQVTAEDHSRFCIDPASGTQVNASLRPGDLVWVTGRRLGSYNEFTEVSDNLPYTFVPAINPYTGQTLYLFNRDLRPLRG